MHFSTLATSLAFGTTGWAAYTLQDDYFASGNFFNEFSFWDSAEQEDPTHGFVDYKNERNASDMGLISQSNGNVIMKADYTQVPDNGRAAVRITSNKSYQSGLIVVDIDHMPGGICGTWPAFWTTGPDWPMQGEIDILEGVNNDDTNKYTLHSGPSCSISQNAGPGQGKSVAFSGAIDTSDCNCSSGGDNTGCGIKTSDTQTYGSGFNDNKGGVFATEWTSEGISVYFFPRNSIPSDIDSGNPDPSSWGMPQAHFQGDCDFASSFTNQQIVFTNTFCGDWAGEVWSGSSCAASTGASTCEEYVKNNPRAFENAFWSVNALKVYQNDGSSSEPEPSASQSAPYPTGPSVPVSSGATAPSGAPSGAPPVVPSVAPSPSGWAPTASAPAPGGWQPTTSAVAVPAPSPSSPAEQPWGQGPPTNTWGGHGQGPPWASQESGSPWAQQEENDDGSWGVGTPAMVKRQHARHLAQHKRHAAGRLG